jgi:hypothetical protein
MKTPAPFLLLCAGLVTAGCQPSATTGGKSGPEEGPRVKIAVGDKVEDREGKVVYTLDAGEVDDGVKYEKVFEVRNAGDQPLRLNLIQKNCSCGEVEAPTDPIAPGATVKITFRWSPTPVMVGESRLSATFETNDPRNKALRLEVKSTVNPAIRLEPSATYLDFDSFNPQDTPERTLKVYSTRLKEFALDVSTGTSVFAIAKEPLTANEQVGDRVARSGFRLTLRTTDRLPLHYFRDELTLKIRIPDEEPRTFTLPVYALVKNGQFTVTPSQVEFTVPKLAEGDSKTVRVQFIDTSGKSTVEVVGVEPSFLTTTKAVSLGKGQWQFMVRLPKDSAPAKLQLEGFFEGQVLLKTSASDKPVPVRVKWDLATLSEKPAK